MLLILGNPKGDIIRFDITFYNNIKQPYKYERPFSIISSVTKYESQ